MSVRKLSMLNTPKGSLRDRSNEYLGLAKKNRDNELAKRRGLNDVHAPAGRMQPELDYQQNQQELQQELQRQQKEHENMQLFIDNENAERQEKIRQRQKAQKEEAEINKMDASVQENITEQSKIHQQKTIEEVIENRTRYADTKWLLIETESKYYKVGNFLRKYDFSPSGFERLGLYLPLEDYPTFYRDSRILVFYEFKNAVFSDRDLDGKYFKTDERYNYPNFDATKIDTSTRTKDLNNKKEYVRIAKEYMRTAIIHYLEIPSNISDDSKLYFETIIKFYEKIVPMVQRYLENNPDYDKVLITVGTNVKNLNNKKMGKITSIYPNGLHKITYDGERTETEISKDNIQIIGNIDNAIRQLEWIQQTISKSVSGYTAETYVTGKYIESIERLLSPVVAAPVRLHEAPVSAAAGPSAYAAPSASAWGMPSVFTNMASAASDTASYLGNSAANALRASTGFTQDSKGMVFDKGKAPDYTPPVAPLSEADDMAVSNVYKDLELRRGERADYYGDTKKYHGHYDYTYPSNDELMDTAKQVVGERKAAAADANKMPIFSVGGPKFGGKRKSKRKQRRSQKQKKSRKQRR